MKRIDTTTLTCTHKMAIFDNIHRHGQPRSYKTCIFIGSAIVHVPCRISECRVLNECTCTHHIAVPSPLIISKKYISCFRSCYCNTLLKYSFNSLNTVLPLLDEKDVPGRTVTLFIFWKVHLHWPLAMIFLPIMPPLW